MHAKFVIDQRACAHGDWSGAENLEIQPVRCDGLEVRGVCKEAENVVNRTRHPEFACEVKNCHLLWLRVFAVAQKRAKRLP